MHVIPIASVASYRFRCLKNVLLLLPLTFAAIFLQRQKLALQKFSFIIIAIGGRLAKRSALLEVARPILSAYHPVNRYHRIVFEAVFVFHHWDGRMPENHALTDCILGRAHSVDDGSATLGEIERLRIVLISDVRLYREGVAISLSRKPSISLVATTSTMDAIEQLSKTRPDVVMLDASLINSHNDLVRQIGDIVPRIKIVAFAVSDNDYDVMACAESGISAYVAREGSADDLVDAAHKALRGEFLCSPRVTALLFHRIAELSAERRPPNLINALTLRERQIVPLIKLGYSNKEIARQLHVEVATVKNHVHSILEKFQIRRRGQLATHVDGSL